MTKMTERNAKIEGFRFTGKPGTIFDKNIAKKEVKRIQKLGYKAVLVVRFAIVSRTSFGIYGYAVYAEKKYLVDFNN